MVTNVVYAEGSVFAYQHRFHRIIDSGTLHAPNPFQGKLDSRRGH